MPACYRLQILRLRVCKSHRSLLRHQPLESKPGSDPATATHLPVHGRAPARVETRAHIQTLCFH